VRRGEARRRDEARREEKRRGEREEEKRRGAARRGRNAGIVSPECRTDTNLTMAVSFGVRLEACVCSATMA
jgi:hypothetical protein